MILQELLRVGKVSVLPLAKRLKVSPATIRRISASWNNADCFGAAMVARFRFSQCSMSPFVTFPIITSRSDSAARKNVALVSLRLKCK